ncbi:DUF1177 domain-containing protein [Bifidobacterium sp. ESL0690]|uniref:DUF1177 domain-containing protein n=1 Tax=Bifidobacterium sp. ESL0690 TaxID=2983214 RepID=UPI0023F67EAA|nr:DUF1177 domain-containing protein [Bifidobacterium sp. ESL0690]WEV45907.1 DUF1177 domain-containing protein [Bifidobacterium sp. ESL0690]
MLLRQMLEVYDLLDKPDANGDEVAGFLHSRGADDVTVKVVGEGEKTTDCLKVVIPGSRGKSKGGDAPTLGVVGRLGGVGARPKLIGAVSDGDGALAALTVALKLAEMHRNGDVLEGDVIVATHVCPDAPTIEHDPVPFMNSPINMATMNRMEVDERMDAILSIDTTKGNRVINVNGIAISPTVKDGAILPVSDDIMDLMTQVTGKMPEVFALSQQDITPYGNDLYHLNSILQPAIATTAPVIGVAIAVEQIVAGCATGATHGEDVEQAARFAVEVAKSYTDGSCRFYDEDEYRHLVDLYGDFSRFRK